MELVIIEGIPRSDAKVSIKGAVRVRTERLFLT